jgi:hypothetical protein
MARVARRRYFGGPSSICGGLVHGGSVHRASAHRTSVHRTSVHRSSVVRVALATVFVAAMVMIVAAGTPNLAAANQTEWSAPLNVDGSTLIESVSCASSLFCAAVDQAGDALRYNGSSWSAPQQITEGDLYSVSCPSTTFCIAVGGGGGENTWNGSSWNGPNPVGSETFDLQSVSCTNSNFCIAVDDNGSYDSWNGTAWTGPTVFDGNIALVSVSCASTIFCIAVDSKSNALVYNGSSWSSPDHIDPSIGLNAVSCSSITFCVAVDNAGNALTYNGSSWSTDDIDGTTQLLSVSCTTASFCVAGDSSGNAFTYNGSSWSSVSIDDNVITSVSCPSTSFCAATDDAGYALTYGWVSASYSCDFPGLGDTTTPVLLSEAPSPPASIPAPGTFQTTLSAEVTIPSAAVNNAISQGASSVTIGSQTVETDALTPSDSPSSSVDPNTLTTSGTNLPITFTPQSSTPYTYSTTYNPETWQTVNVPGTVDFTPGNINLSLTYLLSSGPTPESVPCTAPSGVTDLDTTNVTAPGGTPSIQVPPSVPPLQSQVSTPLDAGWAIEIANTSTVDVTGLSAAITVRGGGPTLTYDFAGMSKTGTTCTSSGTNMATCSVGTLAGGDTETLNVLVDTAGLPLSTTITGTANVTSTNASSQSASLTGVSVVVVKDGSAAVAVPSTPLSSSSKALSKHLRAKTTLTLPAKVPAMGPDLSNSLVGPLVKMKGPPVSVKLQALRGSQDPELCPPASGGCEGDIIEIEGNFAAYTSTAKPISAVIEIYYGSSVPAGHIYFQDSAGDVPTALPACVKTGGHYNTPCVDGPEQIIGATGKKSTEDTVFFTGGDPLVGRR